MTGIGPELLAIFESEHRDHLNAIRAQLSAFGHGGGRVDLAEIGRRMHSLKGAARVVGLQAVERLAHQLETYFSKMSVGQELLAPDKVELLHSIIDGIEDWVATLREGSQSLRNPADLEARVAALTGVPATPTSEPSTPPVGGPLPPFRSLDTVRVSSASLDRLLQSVGNLIGEAPHHDRVGEEIHGVANDVAEFARGLTRYRRNVRARMRAHAHQQNIQTAVGSIDGLEQQMRSHQLAKILGDEGFSVDCFGRAEDGLAALGGDLPDLVIVDHKLPGMQGDEMIRQLRMNLRTRGLPILMLTDLAGDADHCHSLEAGADAYVAKSAGTDVLMLRVRSLVRKTTAAAALPTTQRSREAFRRPRLLVVDDSPGYRAFLTQELIREGYEVLVATSGTEALAALTTTAFDCVVIDLVMPAMDGIALCKVLNGRRHFADQPFQIIMLTGHESQDDMMRGLEAGADDFVGKSSDVAILKARIRAILRRKFLYEENRRISSDFRRAEVQLEHAEEQRRAAEARAALVSQLEAANQKLREAQAQLVQSAKMASLGELVAGIAHEINNPLAFAMGHQHTIQTGLAKLLDQAGSWQNGERRERLGKLQSRVVSMRQGLDRIKDIVQNLRTFSRLDAGEFRSFNIHQSIDHVLTLLGHRMKGNVEVIRKYGDGDTLYGMAGQLNQVLMNLVSNALDAIEDQGTVTIRTWKDATVFRISVSDTGKGIPDDIRERIFEPFFTTKPVGAGTGLGLAISYSIVEAHQGTIEARSATGTGTTFTVSIPLDLEERHRRKPQHYATSTSASSHQGDRKEPRLS